MQGFCFFFGSLNKKREREMLIEQSSSPKAGEENDLLGIDLRI